MQMFHPGSWTESELLIFSNISTIESCQWEPLLLLGFGQNPFWVKKHQSATVFLIPNNFLWQLSLFHFPETTIFCLFLSMCFCFRSQISFPSNLFASWPYPGSLLWRSCFFKENDQICLHLLDHYLMQTEADASRHFPSVIGGSRCRHCKSNQRGVKRTRAA